MDRHFHYDWGLLPEYLDILRSRLQIAVVYGGDKDQPCAVVYKIHNPHSWKSYETVAYDLQGVLQELGFKHIFALPDDEHLPQRLAAAQIHLAWLNTGGVQGFNPVSHAPAMLEMLGIPYKRKRACRLANWKKIHL
jgi:D-alanine-D-alanine ligase